MSLLQKLSLSLATQDHKVDETTEGMDDLSIGEEIEIFRLIDANRREELPRNLYAKCTRNYKPALKVEAPDEVKDEDEGEDEDPGKENTPCYYRRPDGGPPSKNDWVFGYKSEANMSKGAGKPVSRPGLGDEAQKLIGDTEHWLEGDNLKPMRSDTFEKWKCIRRGMGKGVVATACGVSHFCYSTWEHMKQYAATHENATVSQIVKSGETMPRKYEKFNTPILMEMLVFGFDNGKPAVFCLKDGFDQAKKRLNTSREILNKFIPVGCGKDVATKEWENAVGERDIETLEFDEVCKYLEKALSAAALDVPAIGGEFRVLHVSPTYDRTIKLEKSFNVLDYYRENCDSIFSKFDYTSVFIFYKPEDVWEEDLVHMLRSAGLIRNCGHPLTLLKGGYYVRRVIYRRRNGVEVLLRKAIDVPHDETPEFVLAPWRQLVKQLNTNGQLNT